MVHTGSRFMEVGEPVGEFMKLLTHDFYWAYNWSKDQWMDISKSVATTEAVNVEENTVWGLNLSEPSSKQSVYREQGLIRDQILYHLLSNVRDNKGRLLGRLRDRSNDEFDEDEYAKEAFRNLSNAWRDEYAVYEPLFNDFADYARQSEGKDGLGEEKDIVEAKRSIAESEVSLRKWRMQTAEWRIVKCYYSLYKSASAIVRSQTLDNVGDHNGMLDKHYNSFMQSKLRSLYVFPLLPVPNQVSQFILPSVPFPLAEVSDQSPTHQPKWKDRYKESYETLLNNLENKISDISEVNPRKPEGSSPEPKSFYHMMKILREWASYHHGGIFSRLYGKGYIKYIDTAIRLSSFAALASAEVALICTFGYNRFKKALKTYCEACAEGIADSAAIVNSRNVVYDEVLSGF